MKKRNIKYIVIHCTASLSTAAVSTIKNGWKARGWKNPGYHRLIDAQGKAHILSSYANVVMVPRATIRQAYTSPISVAWCAVWTIANWCLQIHAPWHSDRRWNCLCANCTNSIRTPK